MSFPIYAARALSCPLLPELISPQTSYHPFVIPGTRREHKFKNRWGWPARGQSWGSSRPLAKRRGPGKNGQGRCHGADGRSQFPDLPLRMVRNLRLGRSRGLCQGNASDRFAARGDERNHPGPGYGPAFRGGQRRGPRDDRALGRRPPSGNAPDG